LPRQIRLAIRCMCCVNLKRCVQRVDPPPPPPQHAALLATKCATEAEEKGAIRREAAGPARLKLQRALSAALNIDAIRLKSKVIDCELVALRICGCIDHACRDAVGESAQCRLCKIGCESTVVF